MRIFTSRTTAADWTPDAGSANGLTATTKNVRTKRWAMRRPRTFIGRLILMAPGRRPGKQCVPSRDEAANGCSPDATMPATSVKKRLENRAPAALEKGTLEKRRGRTGSVDSGSFSLFESSWKRGKKQKTRTSINDSRSEESILNYALPGLKDGVHLTRQECMPCRVSEAAEQFPLPAVLMLLDCCSDQNLP